MQNIWKRSLSMFLALVMIIGMLPMNALATETEETIMEETMMEETVLPETAETMPSAETVEAVEVTEEPVAETEAPAETAAETAPAEETEADTVPEETAAATIPVETVFEEEMPQQETPVGESAPGEALSEADFLRSLEMSIASGDQEYVLQDPVTISGHVTIPKDYTLRVCENGSLTVAEQAVLEVKGVLHLDNGSVTVHGTLDNIGELQDLGGVIADVGADDTVLTIGETGELINGGYFQMSAGALKLDGTFTYQGGLIFISSDLILSAEDEAKIGRENIIFDIFADSENDMIEGNILREGYQQQNVFVIGDVRVISLMELPASENFNLQVGYKTSRINVDIPGKLTIAVGAGLTVNNALYILDNGFVQIEEGARLVNNGRIGNLGTLLAYYNVENNGTMTGNPVENERDEQSDFEDILADCTGNDYVLTEPVTLIRDLTIDLQGGTFYIGQGGMITVPENVTLTVVGQMEVTAGKIIVLNGGLLECIDGHIQIRRGLVYFETGAGYNVRMSGPAYWEEKGDTEPRLTFYTVADEGSGVSPNWGNYRSGSTSLLPGWFMTGLFCFQEWDSVNYEWNMIFMDPQYLNCGEGLTMTRLKDMPNPGHILDGDKYGQKYVTIAADNVFDVDSYVAYNFGGEEYRLNVRIERPQEHAFYTDAYASNETFLNHISNCYEVDPLAEEHFFYYIFTAGGGWKVESFEVVNNPFENVPVEEVEWEQISDTVYKITIKPEVAANMPAGGFPVQVNVSVSGSKV